MAKISARGCTKLAQANRERELGTADEHSITRARDRLALRSDGAILGASDYLQNGYSEKWWSRGGYSVRAKIKDARGRTRAEMVQIFTNYAERRGYALKSS
jgi:hypothetical protein